MTAGRGDLMESEIRRLRVALEQLRRERDVWRWGTLLGLGCTTAVSVSIWIVVLTR